MDYKISEFNGFKIELRKMRLKHANELFPLVLSGMTKIALGKIDFFAELKPNHIDLFQEKMCDNIFKHIDKKQDDGTIITTKKNLTLEDIEDSIENFLPLLYLFLEFNFGFFSQARKILEPMSAEVSESGAK